jgi:acetyl-CoA acyltransferase
LTGTTARQAYEKAGVDPEDIDLVELHGCFGSACTIHVLTV